jgi:hypothetical protein
MAAASRQGRRAARTRAAAAPFSPGRGRDNYLDFRRPSGKSPAHTILRKEERGMSHIFISRLSFAPDAVIGVTLIGVYFVWIVATALRRVSQGEHMRH